MSTLKKQTQPMSLSIAGMLYCVSGSQLLAHLQEEATFVHLCNYKKRKLMLELKCFADQCQRG